MSRTDDIELKNLPDVTTEVEEKLLKVIIIGDTPVGKTSFTDRYVHGKFGPGRISLGVDFAFKVVKSLHQTVKLQLWDINGSERASSMVKLYYKDASACIIMFDITKRRTFERVLLWKNDVDDKVTLSDGRPIPCLLLANKVDIPSHCVSDEEIEELCKKHCFIGWRKISVIENTNVEESMNFLVEETLLRTSLAD